MAYRSYIDEEKCNLINLLNKSHELSLTTAYEAEKWAKLADLAYADEVETVKKSVTYTVLTSVIPKAQEWLNKVESQKIDRRRKYDEKEAYDFLLITLKHQLFGEHPIEIVDILSYGYDNSAWWIEFTCNGIKFNLAIPVIEHLDVRNFKDVHKG